MSDDDFRDFLTALSAAGVKHLVVGAYAMASHGYVRATGDLDTWIEPTIEMPGGSMLRFVTSRPYRKT